MTTRTFLIFLTAGQIISVSLVDSLIVFGNEDAVAAQFTELLAAGLDELMVTLVPIREMIWLRLISNRALDDFLAMDYYPYNRKIMKACGSS